MLSSSKIVLALSAMLVTEPVRRLLRFGKAPAGILAAAGMLAPMVLNAGARDGLHYAGKADFVAHCPTVNEIRTKESRTS